MSDRSPLPRTRWAEHHVEGFIAPALVAEFVFRGLQVIDNGIQREVADFLIHRETDAVLVSQKCQEDPSSRAGDRLQRWAERRSGRAAAQLKGALRKVGEPIEIWCDHPRRGRVTFSNGLPTITHAVATIEVLDRVALQAELPLEHQGTPISYLSVNDFLNLSEQLRTVPELIRYLDARRSLSNSVLLTLGIEKMIFSYYLLYDGDFSGFQSIAEAELRLREHELELSDLIAAKANRDAYAMPLEHVAHEMSDRHPHYDAGLSEAVLDRYEPQHDRRAYLRMQELIAGLNLGERAELGRAFDGAIRNRESQGGAGFTFVATMVSSRPDCVFLLGSFGATDSFTRDGLLLRFDPLTRAAMAHYSRTVSLIIVDRDGESYEVGINQLSGAPSAEDITNGRNIFGRLKVFVREARLRPT